MAEATETSPLLAVVESNHAEASNSQDDITSFPEITSYTAARDFFVRPIKILTKSILITSVVSCIVLLASDILVANAPFTLYYRPRLQIESVGFYVLCAFFAALINLHFKLLILFNFLIDIFLFWNILFLIPGVFDYGYPTDFWCRIDSYDPTKGVKPGCLSWVLAAKILIGIGGGLAVLVGVGHLVLFVMRCVAAWKSKFWRRPSGFGIPGGELTFQFTIKLLRQETGPTVPANGIAATLSPSLAHSPSTGR